MVERKLTVERQKQALAEAVRRTVKIEEFISRFPPLNDQTLIPPITWEEVRRQLEALAFNRGTRSMVAPLLDGLIAKAMWQTPEMVVRDLILLTGLVMDENYEPAEDTEPEPDDGGYPMP
jgi:hypothetical protein